MFKRFLLSLFFVLAFATQGWAVGCTGTGNCYWVGGTGNASNTAKWATASGGGTTGGLPGPGDIANIDANSGGGTYTIDGSPTYLGFIVVNINKTDVLSFSGSLTTGALGTVSLTGLSSTNRLFIKSSVLGTTRAFNVPLTGVVTVTNVDFQDITMGGGFDAGATASSIGDALGNTFGWSSVQPDVSAAQTLVATGTINWSTAANWTSRVPLPQDDVTLPSMGAATTLTADMPHMGRNITATNYNRTLSFASTSNTLFGNVALGASGTFSGTQGLTLAGRGAQTVTSNTKSFPQAITVVAFGGTYQQQDNFVVPDIQNFTILNGTWDSQQFNLSCGGVSASAGTAKTLKATSASTWSITGTGGTIFSMNAVNAMTLFAARIKLTGNVTTSAIFSGAGFIYGSLWWSSTTSIGTLIITGANTFASLQSDNTTARTWQFPNGVTQTIGPNGFKIVGRGEALTTLKSDSAGQQFTLKTLGGGTIKANYLAIKDSKVIGGNWYAGTQSVNNGNNTGWKFMNPDNGLILMLRH